MNASVECCRISFESMLAIKHRQHLYIHRWTRIVNQKHSKVSGISGTDAWFVLILDGSQHHVAHVYSKTGFYCENTFQICLCCRYKRHVQLNF